MAGIIEFIHVEWQASNGSFRALVNALESILPDTPSSNYIREQLVVARDSGMNYVDFSDSLSPKMREEFLDALQQYIVSEENIDSSELPNPEVFQGHLLRLVELRSILEHITYD